ncbi:MarR family transcriptional regulator [Nakamurella silvestris]|nr:MarR family transcriptional regulator [Nakamurella silvestris]
MYQQPRSGLLTCQQVGRRIIPVTENKAAPRWLDGTESRMWRAWIDMHRHLDRVLEQNLADAGMSMADFVLLVPLSESPEGQLRARDLGAEAGWDRSRLSHQIRRMEQRGLVARVDCETDARGTFIRLTPQGRAAIEAAAPGHVESVRENFLDLLDPSEIDLITAVAERVLERVRPRA